MAMVKEVSLTRIKALLRCIQAGGNGSARHYWEVYQAALDHGYMVYRSVDHTLTNKHAGMGPTCKNGYFLTSEGLSLIKE